MILIARHKVVKWLPSEKEDNTGDIKNIRGIHFHLQDTSQIYLLIYE